MNSPLHPLAIVDIGSNSVRLVVYEGKTRVPAVVYNEKAMCGLGRNVAVTGLLAEDSMDHAFKALARYKTICGLMNLENIQIMATAAVRDARNGLDFLDRVKKLWDVPTELISGEREAYLSALGIASGFYQPDGVMGDLGGGSLEIANVSSAKSEKGVSLPLGGLALQDLSGGSLKEALKITHQALRKAEQQMKSLEGRSFYAIGGTWRAIAKMHQEMTRYPAHFMHNYVLDVSSTVKFLRQVERSDEQAMKFVTKDIEEARRPLLAYGALVLQEIIKQGKPKNIIISATGVRDGMLFEHLGERIQSIDPLLDAAERMSLRRSRSPKHGYELADWLQQFIASCNLPKLENQERLIRAVCLLSDLSWRSHPDYRAEHSLAQIACAYFLGVDHPTRAFLALSIFCRYVGVNGVKDAPQELRIVAGEKLVQFARLIAAIVRIGYSISVAMAGVLPRTPLLQVNSEIILTLPKELEQLANGRLLNRLKQLGKIMDRPVRVELKG